MGSLPSPPLTAISKPAAGATKIDAGDLRCLFDAQRSHLDYFFDHLDYEESAAFARALLDAPPGAIFFSGVGKSGIVVHKLSQTLASLGFARSSFLPPVDALHGEIGALFRGDLLVLLSKSGASDELLALVPCARAKGAKIISVTSKRGCPLAGLCDMNVHLPLQSELCPFNLAPVTSTAIQMVFGDTVFAALMGAKNLTREQYAVNHPAGKIGKSLIFKRLDWIDHRLATLITDDPSVIDSSLAQYGDIVYPDKNSIVHRLDVIDKCFSHDTVEEILDALEAEVSRSNEEWCVSALNKLKEASPLSLKVSLRSIREARFQTLDECLVREYRMSLHAFSQDVSPDFIEGVRSRVIDKDLAPKWDPPSLDKVSEDMVDEYFSPLGESEPELQLPTHLREAFV